MRKERQDGDACVSSDHWNVDIGDIQSLLLGIECLGADLQMIIVFEAIVDSEMFVCSHHIERRHSHEFSLVIYSEFLECLGRHWHCGIHWIRNHVDNGRGAMLSNALNQSLDNSCIDLPRNKIVSPSPQTTNEGTSKSSCLSIPGFLGTPAGITTRSAPDSAPSNSSAPV